MSNVNEFVTFKKTSTLTATALTTLMDVDVRALGRVWISIINGSVNSIVGFTLSHIPVDDGIAQVFASAAGDFTSPVSPILRASGDLTTQGGGTTGFVYLDATGMHTLRIRCGQGSASSNTVEVIVNGRG